MASAYNPTPSWGTKPAAPVAQPQTNRYEWGGDGFLGGKADFGRFSEWAPYMITGQLGGAASRGIEGIYGAMDGYDAARRRALNAVSPGGRQNLLQSFMSRQRAMANETGRTAAAMLRSQGIQGADASAMLDAQNRAADQGNEFASQLFGPQGELQSALQAMDLNNPETVAPILRLIMQMNPQLMARVQQNNAEHAQRASQSGIGGILGSLIGSATGGGFNFGGGGSMPAYGQGARNFVPGHF